MTSNTNPILVFPRIQPFGSDVSSSLGRVYSRQATGSENCEISSMSFVMKYCPTSTVVKNHASVQILITRFCCGSLSTRCWYFCNRSSCAGSSVEGIGVFVHKLADSNNGSDGPGRISSNTGIFSYFLYSTGIFSCSLLLLPWFSSTCRQTNDDNTRNVLEDCLWFSRIQLLHHFLDVDFHDEEDE